MEKFGGRNVGTADTHSVVGREGEVVGSVAAQEVRPRH